MNSLNSLNSLNSEDHKRKNSDHGRLLTYKAQTFGGKKGPILRKCHLATRMDPQLLSVCGNANRYIFYGSY